MKYDETIQGGIFLKASIKNHGESCEGQTKCHYAHDECPSEDEVEGRDLSGEGVDQFKLQGKVSVNFR